MLFRAQPGFDAKLGLGWSEDCSRDISTRGHRSVRLCVDWTECQNAVVTVIEGQDLRRSSGVLLHVGPGVKASAADGCSHVCQHEL